MMTDPVADMLTRIRNSVRAGKRVLDVPFSKFKCSILMILVREGYLEKIDNIPSLRVVRVYPKYTVDGKPCLTHLLRLSSPGRRVYRASAEVGVVLSGMGLAILSTSKGLLTDKDARELKLGGELVCSVW